MANAVDRVQALFSAFNERDWPRLKALMHPEVEWRQYTAVPDAGVWRGPDAVVDGMLRGQWVEQFPDIQADCHEVVDAGEHVVAIGEVRGRGRESGLDLYLRFAHAYHFESGLVIEVHDVAGESHRLA